MDGIIGRHTIWVVWGGALLPLGACAAMAVFRGGVTNATAVLVLVVIVVAAASTGSRTAGIIAAVSAGVWFDFFLTRPYDTFAINDRNDVEATALLVLIGAAVTEVALWGHRQQAHAGRRAGYLDGVLATAESVLLEHDSPDQLVDHIADQIGRVLGVARCRFVERPAPDPRTPVLGHDGQVNRGGRTVDVERDGLPTDDDIALLVTRGDVILGHFMLTAAADIARPTLEQRRVAVLLANQAGSVLAHRAH
ncbi:MAG: DUF4118 domain-containing protein [Nocardioidaceae bacterium]